MNRYKTNFIGLFIRRILRKKNNRSPSVKLFKPGPSKYLVITLKTIFSFVASLLLLGSLIYFLLSDYFKITQISCEKENFVCPDNEKIIFNNFLGQNIILLDPQRTIDQLKTKYSKIAQITVIKKVPHTLVIKISERKPEAVVTKDEKQWFLIDETGYIYQTINNQPKDLPLIYLNLPSKLEIGKSEEQIVNQSMTLIASLKDNFVHPQKIIIYPQNFTLYLSEGIIATISAEKEVKKQVDSLQFILRQSKIDGDLPSTIDLRFDKPVVRF